MKTITAENISSGFRRPGIVPFNPGALNLPEESCPANPAVSDSSDHDDQENNPNVANAPGPGPFFTDEEDWLSVNHPQSVSVDLAPAEQCGSPSNSGRGLSQLRKKIDLQGALPKGMTSTIPSTRSGLASIIHVQFLWRGSLLMFLR